MPLALRHSWEHTSGGFVRTTEDFAQAHTHTANQSCEVAAVVRPRVVPDNRHKPEHREQFAEIQQLKIIQYD